MFAVALTAVAALLATGWLATRERFVDDEVAARVPAVREPDAASRPG
jgi:CP family cyanate transporter-like MFS transporter